MSNQPIDSSLIDDNRAVAPVIGVVILFGFLILALSLYQAEVVPQQNAEVEFQHFEEVRNDLVELRAGILQAGSTDQPQYQTVRLGTSYPTRIFAINPPDPAGTIRTTDSYPITIAYASNDTVIETIPTRFIEYRPGYNELDQSPTWYDASVLYIDARDEGGGIAVIEDQTLVDGSEVQITALQNEFRRSGTGRVTLELRPADSVTGELPDSDLTITVPTRLSGEEYWNQTNVSSVTDDLNGDGIHNLTIETTADNLTVDTVGVQEAPEEPTQIGNGGGDGGTGGDGGNGGAGTGSFSNVEASDLPINEGEDSGSAQTLSFTVDSTLLNGESVTIDLTSAQQGDFDYESSGINSIDGSLNKGSAQFTSQDSIAVIRYTATQDISSGEQIQLEVSDVEYGNGNQDEYTVSFTRSDGLSASDTFSDDGEGGGNGGGGNEGNANA